MKINAPHVLMIPSWYPTPDQPLNGIFFQEYARVQRALGTHLGVIYPEIRPLRALTPSGLKHYHFQSSQTIENDIFIHRMHGWNLFPSLLKLQLRHWTYHAAKLAKSYFKNHGKPDLIHAQSSIWAGFAARQIAEETGIPYCITEHLGNFIEQDLLGTEKLNLWIQPKLRDILRASAKVITVSTAMKTALQNYITPLDIPITVIPNSVDTRFFHPRLNKSKKSSFDFLTISALNKGKNISLLLNAFARLHKQNPTSKLIIGGDGPERSELLRLAKTLKIDDSCHFLGALTKTQVRDALQHADCFVLPSRTESFSVVCIEAIASGTPVIATRCGGPEDIIDSSVGCLVESNDELGLTEAMRRMSENRNDYPPENLAEYAEQRFGNAPVSDRYRKLYKEIISP